MDIFNRKCNQHRRPHSIYFILIGRALMSLSVKVSQRIGKENPCQVQRVSDDVFPIDELKNLPSIWNERQGYTQGYVISRLLIVCIFLRYFWQICLSSTYANKCSFIPTLSHATLLVGICRWNQRHIIQSSRIEMYGGQLYAKVSELKNWKSCPEMTDG